MAAARLVSNISFLATREALYLQSALLKLSVILSGRRHIRESLSGSSSDMRCPFFTSVAFADENAASVSSLQLSQQKVYFVQPLQISSLTSDISELASGFPVLCRRFETALTECEISLIAFALLLRLKCAVLFFSSSYASRLRGNMYFVMSMSFSSGINANITEGIIFSLREIIAVSPLPLRITARVHERTELTATGIFP